MSKYNEIMSRIQEHYNEALEYFEESHIVGIWLQGSQNYGLDLPTSDVDTKLIITPSFKNIALVAKPVSTTHVRENNEHIDFKDIRLYIETFYKQNLNFLEILFTPYFIINPLYEQEWNKLVAHKEEIARMNPFCAVKTMKGIAFEKYHAMEHRYPSKVDIIDKYGYDGKQNSHLLRVDDYLERYIAGESYEKCLQPSAHKIPRIMDYKALNIIPLEEAREEAKQVLAHTEQIANAFCADREQYEDPKMRELLEEVSYNIMRISVMEELK